MGYQLLINYSLGTTEDRHNGRIFHTFSNRVQKLIHKLLLEIFKGQYNITISNVFGTLLNILIHIGWHDFK